MSIVRKRSAATAGPCLQAACAATGPQPKRARQDVAGAPRAGDLQIHTPPADQLYQFPVWVQRGSAFDDGTAARLPPSRSACRQLAEDASSASGSTTSWEDLPDEVILIIFSYLRPKYLARISLTCSRFYFLARDHNLRPHISLVEKTLPTCSLLSALLCDPVTLKLNTCSTEGGLEFPSGWTPSRRFHRLTSLQLISTKLSPEMVELLFSCLDLAQSEISDAVLRCVARHCPKLTHLGLRMASNFTYEGIDSIMSGCPSLRVLNLAWVRPSLDIVTELICFGGALEALDLSGWGHYVTDDTLCMLLTRANKMRILDLSDCYRLTDTAVEALVRMPDLAELALSRCNNLSLPALVRVATMPDIRVINLFGCNREVLTIVGMSTEAIINKSIMSLLDSDDGLQML